ncbi:MAG: rod shape-determining protein MreC [Pseudomonadota bacterium]
MSLRLRFFIVIFLGVMVLLAIMVHSDPEKAPSLPERILLEAVAAVQNGFVTSARGIEEAWRGYFFLVGLREENNELKKALTRSHTQINQLREAGLANQRLNRLLNFQDSAKFPAIGARVVSWDPGPWFKTMTIDRGESAGLRPGMPVICDLGVVGRIVETSPHFSKVLLIIDYNSSIDAVIQRNRVRGILAGKSEAQCALKYVLKNDDVVRGDLVTSSGRGGVFPRGLVLGSVVRVRKPGHDIFLEVEIAPAVDFDRLEEILVVLAEKPPFSTPPPPEN